MTTRKTFAVALAALVLVGWALVTADAAPAAPRGGPGGPVMQPPTADQIVAGMAQMLGLSKAQQGRLRPIYAAQARQMKALWEGKRPTLEQKMAKTRAIQKSTDQQMRKVLTAAQIRKLDDMELDGLTRYLGLSEKQRSKLRPIIAKRNQQVGGLADNTKLNGQQRLAKTGAIFQSTQKQMRAVLTPAQRKKFDAGLQSMRGPGGGGRAGGKPPR